MFLKACYYYGVGEFPQKPRRSCCRGQWVRGEHHHCQLCGGAGLHHDEAVLTWARGVRLKPDAGIPKEVLLLYSPQTWR